jgi:hypothetical protein
MVVNFRTHRITRGERELTYTSTLNKKKKYHSTETRYTYHYCKARRVAAAAFFLSFYFMGV